jgi:Uma2 family endonuclease
LAAVKLRIGPADHGRMMTLQEFMDAAEEPGYRYELARGVLEATEVPDDPHALIERLFVGRLRDYEKDHPGVFYRVGSSGSARSWLPGMVSGRNPDIAVVLPGAPKDLRGRRRAAMAIEIVSEGREAHDRDYVAKREEYLAYGLREYWIVDRFLRRVTVLLRDGDAWIERTFEGDSVATGPMPPRFAIRLGDIWSAAEGDDAPGAPDA